MIVPSYKSDDDITLYDIADLHRGNGAFDKRLLDKVVDRVATDKQAFWVSTGDLMECALKNSKSRHRDACLCYDCGKFKPKDRELNCAIANAVFKNCVDFGIVTPVWECPDFE